jgi:Gas vesicle synthesis protein GvpO
VAQTDRARKSASSAKKTTAKKGSAEKASPATRSAAKKTASKRTASKSTASKRTASKSTASKRTASKTPARKRTTPNGSGERSGQRSGGSPASRIASSAARQLLDLTGREAEGVVAISKNGDSWTVEVEVLELRRIPNTTDVLASYEVTVDNDGDLVGYKRLRRYTRGASRDE